MIVAIGVGNLHTPSIYDSLLELNRLPYFYDLPSTTSASAGGRMWGNYEPSGGGGGSSRARRTAADLMSRFDVAKAAAVGEQRSGGGSLQLARESCVPPLPWPAPQAIRQLSAAFCTG